MDLSQMWYLENENDVYAFGFSKKDRERDDIILVTSDHRQTDITTKKDLLVPTFTTMGKSMFQPKQNSGS